MSLTSKKLGTKKGSCIFLASKEKNLATCEYHQQKTLSFRHRAYWFSGSVGRISRETASWIPRELGSLPGRDAGSLAVSLRSVESVEGTEV